VSFDPKLPRDPTCVDAGVNPPSQLVACTVHLAMMSAAERHGELVAHLEAETAWLREAQMVGIAGLSSTDQAGLFGYKSKVDLIANATGLGKGERVLVNSARYSFFACGSLDDLLRLVPVLRPTDEPGAAGRFSLPLR
jgi:hypothetical protein